MLRYASQPTVTVLAGTVVEHVQRGHGDLRLDYTHSGLAQVRITGGGRRSADAADRRPGHRRHDVAPGHLGRPGARARPGAGAHRTASGSTLALTGDTTAASSLEVWAPPAITAVTWNGAAIAVRRDLGGQPVRADASCPGPRRSRCPTSRRRPGGTRAESPEATAVLRRHGWAAADQDHHQQHHAAAGRPAGAHRRRLRLPPRRRLVPRPVHRRRARRP